MREVPSQAIVEADHRQFVFRFCFPSTGFSFIYSEFIFIILAFASGDLAISALGGCMTFVISGGERSWPYQLLSSLL
jgi:hypothetical protein